MRAGGRAGIEQLIRASEVGPIASKDLAIRCYLKSRRPVKSPLITVKQKTASLTADARQRVYPTLVCAPHFAGDKGSAIGVHIDAAFSKLLHGNISLQLPAIYLSRFIQNSSSGKTLLSTC